MNIERETTEKKFLLFTLLDKSMEPDYKIGDQIEVDTEAEIKDGDIVVAHVEDGKTILRKMTRKDGEYIFTATNGAYEPIFSAAPVIVGKAVRCFRLLSPIGKEESEEIENGKKLSRQQRRICDYLINNGSITTLQAYNELGITCLPKRISELRKLGLEIFKQRVSVKNRFGEEMSVIRYSLTKEGD